MKSISSPTSGGNGGLALPASKSCQLIVEKNSCSFICILSFSRHPSLLW